MLFSLVLGHNSFTKWTHNMVVNTSVNTKQIGNISIRRWWSEFDSRVCAVPLYHFLLRVRITANWQPNFYWSESICYVAHSCILLSLYTKRYSYVHVSLHICQQFLLEIMRQKFHIYERRWLDMNPNNLGTNETTAASLPWYCQI